MRISIKESLKRQARAITWVFALPFVFVYRINLLFHTSSKVFPGWSQLFSIWPGLFGVYIRRAFYQHALSYCSNNCWISFGSLFTHPNAIVGESVYVGNYCCIGDVALKNDVLIGSHVSIMNGSSQHGIDRLDVPIREQPGVWPKIIIGQDTWIGDRAVVMASIGNHCVIGAGSVVTKTVPDFGIAVGVPARVIRYRIKYPNTNSPENG